MHQLWQLVLVQIREFYRNPGILFWVLGFPILMAWGLGIAFTKQGEAIKHVAWVQEGSSSKVSSFIGADVNHKKIGNDKAGYTDYIFEKTTWDEAFQMIKRGKAAMIIHEKGDSLQYQFDPKNPEAQLAHLQISYALKNGHITAGSDEIQTFSQVGTRYIDFLIPGLLAMNIMMSCMWGISYTLIDRRSKKLLRRMVATPMSKSIFLFSHLITRIIMSAIEAIFLLTFAYFYFDITVQGNILSLITMILAGNVMFFGLAVLASSRTSNTQIGNGIINAVVMPMMVSSGIFFSYHNFPDWITPVIAKLPLTLLADSVRSIFIEGAGFTEVWPALWILSGAGTVLYLIALKIYKWY
ncbi:MAG: ABC transporter permease [Flavobacteriales bacterium]